MNITFAPRGYLQIDDARITYRNFAGEGSMYNREGDRNFAVVIPDQEVCVNEDEVKRLGDEPVYKSLADVLIEEGWNVKIKPAREEGESPFMVLPVKVKFNDRGPAIYLKSGEAFNRLDENSVRRLDKIDILSVDLDIRPFDWVLHEGTRNEKRGRSAYLDSMHVTQRIDRFAARYQRDEDDISL